MRLTRAVAPLLVTAILLGGCGERPSFDGEAAHELIAEQCALGPRYPGSEGHAAMIDWLTGRLRPLADEVAVQRFSAPFFGEETELVNVIASFRPTERERVLLGAHYDTRAVADRDPDPEARLTPIPGANDGGSGVAVLVELARLLSETPPDIGVDMVFFDAEDGGDGGGLDAWCVGSTHYARHLGGYCPRYAVVVDMVGDADLAIPIESNSRAAAPQVVRRVWDAAAGVGADSFLDESGPFVFDDHIPLIRAGIPTALVIDFDYEHWHTLEDTPDKCSPASLAEVGSVLVELVYGAADR
ncbi:MAG: M28 family peptidase [Candidatus Eisenbacteria bacterium]|nr:M28 family peptidase [Candidatus Eisenbacteria bacterium]